MTKTLILDGKRALIMGAPAEAAEAIALALAAAGADVALTTATNDATEAFALRRITRGVKALGRRSMNESVDMANGAAVQVAMRQVAKELGGLDILVTGPDLPINKATERLTDADWAHLVNANLSAVFFACRGAYREMRGNEPPGGHVVVLLPAGEPVSGGGAAYAAARSGVEALVEGLKREWAESGVSVGALHSGSGDLAQDILAAISATSAG